MGTRRRSGRLAVAPKGVPLLVDLADLLANAATGRAGG